MTKPEAIQTRDAMRQAHVIDGLSSVRKALTIMEETGRNALVIDKRDPQDEYGLITIGMIAREIFAKNRNPQRVSVYEVMEKPALTISAGMQVRYALRLMTRLGVEHAIVCKGDTLVGVADLRDMSMCEFRDGQSKA